MYNNYPPSSLSNSNEVIYWEKQESLFCALHCLNCLFQQPYYDEITLSELANQLDQQEAQLIGGPSYGNMTDLGNYNIQVIALAIQKFNSYNTCESLDKKEFKQPNYDYAKENGYICNLAQHWYTIRKVNGVWYDLNSLYKRGPCRITDSYMEMHLKTVKNYGFSIYVIRGPKLPEPNQINYPLTRTYQKYLPVSSIPNLSGVANKQSNYSHQNKMSPYQSKLEVQYVKACPHCTPNAFRCPCCGAYNQLLYENEKSGGEHDQAEEYNEEEDEEFLRAIEESKKDQENLPKLQIEEQKKPTLFIPEEPSLENPNSITIVVRLPSGKEAKRRFLKGDTIGDIMNYCLIEENALEKAVQLRIPFQKTFDNPDTTLEEAGFGKRQTLVSIFV